MDIHQKTIKGTSREDGPGRRFTHIPGTRSCRRSRGLPSLRTRGLRGRGGSSGCGERNVTSALSHEKFWTDVGDIIAGAERFTLVQDKLVRIIQASSRDSDDLLVYTMLVECATWKRLASLVDYAWRCFNQPRALKSSTW